MVLFKRRCAGTFSAVLCQIGLLLAAGNVSGEVVLYDFNSPHCGPCQKMRPIVRNLVDAGFPIREIDVSRDRQLAVQHQVTAVPCFILLADGQVIDRLDGLASKADLENMFQKAGFTPTIIRGQLQDRPGLGKRLRDRITGVSAVSQAPPVRSPFAQPPLTRAAPPQAAGAPNAQFASASAGIPSPAAGNTGSNAQQLIDATVRLLVVDSAGQSYGTGTIIESGPGFAIVLTCGHLFRETRGQSPVTADLFRRTPAGSQVVATVQGKVLSYDLDRDVGLIRLETSVTVPFVGIAPEGTQPQSGDSVVSVGCDHGQAPTTRDSHVTTVDRYTGPSNIEATGAPVEGRSGGGLFDAKGQLIGVCFAADERGNEGLYSGLPSIYEELRRAGIAYGNHDAVPRVASEASNPGTVDVAVQPAIIETPALAPPSGQPRFNVTQPSGVSPSSDLVAVSPTADRAPLRAAEHAALLEVARRANGGEVIFIIRSKTPGGKSQILTLDDASPEFIATLIEAAGGDSQTRLKPNAIAVLPPQAAAVLTNDPGPPHQVRKSANDPAGWSSFR